MTSYVTSVGMEVHAELLTESKMFCRCAVGFGGEPNTRVCPVCLGLPGALPVPNQRAIEMVLKTALALNCTIAMTSVFHRKNYFYPDLPKGFQVSQYGETNPFGYNGWLEICNKRVKIRRVHLEEDTGKLTHLGPEGSGVDYNRAGVPLMEIVTDFPPDIENPEEAREYLVRLREILVWIGVCDGKMEEGSLRCEPNVSVRIEGATEYGTKTEIKNLNSFRSVQLGVEFEAKRQASMLETGQKITQETRGWNEATLTSYLMRTKESEADYRYFTCPDLTPMRFDDTYIESLRESLPELPLAMSKRFQEELGLSEYDAGVLVADRGRAVFFEAAVTLGGDAKTVCNLMNGDYAKLLNADTGPSNSTRSSELTPGHLAELAQLITGGTINSKVAKQVMAQMFASGEMPRAIVEKSGLTQVSDIAAIVDAVHKVIEENPGPAQQFLEGKESVLGFLVGAVMKATQGRANPSLVQDEMRRQLNEEG